MTRRPPLSAHALGTLGEVARGPVPRTPPGNRVVVADLLQRRLVEVVPARSPAPAGGPGGDRQPADHPRRPEGAGGRPRSRPGRLSRAPQPAVAQASPPAGVPFASAPWRPGAALLGDAEDRGRAQVVGVALGAAGGDVDRDQDGEAG